jgi:phage baseplate assembly protein W
MNDMKNWQVSINDPTAIVEGAEDIAQCVYTIITTVKGSDPLRADFGSDVYKYIDKPINEVRPLIIYAVSEAIRKWEQRIVVKKCRLEPDSSDGLNIVVEAEAATDETLMTITINM